MVKSYFHICKHKPTCSYQMFVVESKRCLGLTRLFFLTRMYNDPKKCNIANSSAFSIRCVCLSACLSELYPMQDLESALLRAEDEEVLWPFQQGGSTEVAPEPACAAKEYRH